MGRGYGRAPDYDVEGQVRRFAEEYRQVSAANPNADGATLAYLAQRPADRDGYIRSISAMLGTGGGGGGGRLMSVPQTWVPKGPIKKLVKVGTQYQVIYEDESIPPEMVNADQIDEPTGDDERSQVTGTTAANIAANRASQASSQAFQAEQASQQMGFEKAKFNISQQFDQAVQKWREAVDNRDYDAAQFWAQRADEFKVQQTEAQNADRDVNRGQTLLGLGQRPETLGRYLYALQGQQTPQGFDFGTSALPGFGPNAQNPTVGGLGAGAGAPAGLPGMGGGLPAASPIAAPAGAPVVDPRVAAVQQAIATPGAIDPSFVAPGGTNITAQNPNLPPEILQPGVAPLATQGPTAEQISAQDALNAQGRVPRFYSNGVAIYEDGGVIDEPVFGRGLLSGREILIGESGPETIVPEGKTLAEVKGKRGKQKGGTRTFATGGTIGTQAEKALIGGVLYWAGGPYSGQRVDATPANAGDLSPYLANPRLAAPVGSAAAAVPTSASVAAPMGNPGSLPGMPAGAQGRTGGMRGNATQTGSVFNPTNLLGYLQGQFLRPGIPNFPQYQQATGGTSLLSNARWLNNATPSERGLFEGFQRDEAGIMPEDALALAGRMAPRNTRRSLSYGRSY